MPINFCLEKYINQVFVETGAGQGDGIRKALQAGFKKIYSTEINGKLYEECKYKFRKEIAKGRIILVLGDSKECLRDILKNINCEITFWLDAHFSRGDTRGVPKAPLLEELDVISEHSLNTHTILIDDLRLFRTNSGQDWLGIHLSQIIEKLKEINKDYMIFYENGFTKNDVLVTEICMFHWMKVWGTIKELIIFKIFNRIKRFVKMDIKSEISALLTNPLFARLLILLRPHRLAICFYLSSFFRYFVDLSKDIPYKIVGGYGKNLTMDLRIGDKLNPQEIHYWLGFYEPHLQRLFAKVIKRGFVVYDIGAYIGFYSLLAGRLIGPCGKVYAFEPFPYNVERIKRNISLNRMQDRIFCICKAVTDKTGHARPCRVYNRNDWGYYVNTDSLGQVPGKTNLAAETVSLDEFVFHQGYPVPDLLKIDVEGGEYRVLWGARRLLQKYKPVIICELHIPEVRAQIYKELIRLGYNFETVKERGRCPATGIIHIIAWPKERV